ncbi:MAG: hypothetical protein IJB25_09860 [Clostridia bacterium]|nr:hypothetical protein [Clostridia bacterium]
MPAIALITEPAQSYHSSMDTPDRLEKGVMERNAWIVLQMIQKLASAADEKDLESGHTYTKNMRDYARTELEKAFWDQKINAVQVEIRAFIKGGNHPLNACAFDLPKPPNEIPPITVTRLKGGCMTLDKVDPETGRTFETAWNTRLHRPLYWADGKKTVWEIACLCAMEEGKDDYPGAYEEIFSLLRALSVSGIVRLQRV